MKIKEVFFGALLLLLFVGDGKKSIVDVVGMAGVLAFSAVVLLTKKIRFPSGQVIFWWAVVLLYLLIRLPFSDSVAYSLYATVRYCIGFVVFVLFANNTISVRSFGRGVIGFTSVALVSSLFVFFVPSAGTWMPEMSLLSNVYGHHHVAYLLIFALPFAVRGALEKKTKTNGVLAVLFFISLVLTRARGAWFMAALYAIFLIFHKKNGSKSFRFVGIGIAAFFLILFAVTTVAPQIIKKGDFTSARLEYWQQAARALSNNPVFGTGLGTFYLSSLKYQSQPQSYSWLAHSYPLQMMSEIGVMGLIWVIGGIWAIGKKIARSRESQPLFEAVVLTALYSVFEINLDYLVIWTLVWAALGLLYGHKEQSIIRHKAGSWVLYGSLGLLILFYSISVGTEAGQLIVKNKVLLQPFNTRRTLAFLDSRAGDTSLSQRQVETILWFHRKNPEVLAAAHYYHRALLFDPKNVFRFEKYFESIRNEKRPIDPAQLYAYLELTHPDLVNSTVKAMASEPPLLLNGALSGGGNKFILAKMYYLWGLSLGKTQPPFAKEALLLATKLAQSWSFFYLELASYLFYGEGDPAAAKEILNKCLGEMYAKDHCVDFSLETLPPPGTFKNEILSIP